MRTFACGLAALFLLAGCSTPYHPPQFLEPGASFPGLINFVAEADKKSGKKEADVLLVHGMCTHDGTWATDTVAILAAQLAANVNPSTSRSGGGDILIIPATIDTPQGKLLTKSLIWSPLTTPIKQQLCYDQTEKSPICIGAPAFPGKRASLNAKAKDGLLDDCLPDALIYQGQARGEIMRRMREAIITATEGADPKTPLIVISESLGSKILFDTLLEMLLDTRDQRAAQTARRDLGRMAYLIMAANQIPLLQTAEQIPASGEQRTMQAPPPDSLQVLLQERSKIPKDRRGPAIDALTLIAFTDPNDLLSYTLPPERYPGAIVHNVLVSNDRTVLGLFENPAKAHLDYLSNPDVGSLISCGVPRSQWCK